MAAIAILMADQVVEIDRKARRKNANGTLAHAVLCAFVEAGADPGDLRSAAVENGHYRRLVGVVEDATGDLWVVGDATRPSAYRVEALGRTEVLTMQRFNP